MFTTLFAPSAQVGNRRKASSTRMAEIFPMVNSISGTPVEPSAFSLPGCRAAAGDVDRYMMQRESLDHFIETALRSHRTLVRTPREGWRCLPGFYFAVAISVKLLIAAQNDGVSGAVEKSRPQKEPRWPELLVLGCTKERTRHTGESLLCLRLRASQHWDRISHRLHCAGHHETLIEHRC